MLMFCSTVMSDICYGIPFILFVARIAVIVVIVCAFTHLFVFHDFLLCFVSALCIVVPFACTVRKVVHISS